MNTALIVLSGGLIQDAQGVWRTTQFGNRGDWRGTPVDCLRVEAAAIIAQKYPNTLIIASGGRGQMKQVRNAPTLARVIKHELITHGVPKKRIISESRSGTTFGQLWLLAPLLNHKRIQRAFIVSNRYHLPRIRAMLQYHKELKNRWRHIQIVLISAEEILIKKYPQRWKQKITDAYKAHTMKERIRNEWKGISQIHNHTYHYRIT